MASGFEIVDEDYIIELKDESENENTQKSMEYWKNVVEWAKKNSKQIQKSTRSMISTEHCHTFMPSYKKKKRG